jgi:hypothetical protein
VRPWPRLRDISGWCILEEINTWTHLLYIPLEGLDAREAKRRLIVLEEPVANGTPLQGTDDMFGREGDLREPLEGGYRGLGVKRGACELHVLDNDIRCVLVLEIR